MKKKKDWVLITGAASGIGAELSRLFARDRARLVLVDRDAEGLEKISGELKAKFQCETVSLQFDLSHDGAPEAIFEETQKRGIEIGVLVNNAGFGTYGNFWKTDIARDKALVTVNIMAPMLLSKLFLPGMVARRRGKVLNVGSVSGFLASPYAPTYFSSKAFLLAFSQGVAASLKGTGVSVTVVCPGPTYTAFNWHSTEDGSEPLPRKRYQMDVKDVAAGAYRGMQRRQRVVIPGAPNKALAALAKVLPRQFAIDLLSTAQKHVE